MKTIISSFTLVHLCRYATMTYTNYQNHVKPKPQTESKKGCVCLMCGCVCEDEELSEDPICPARKHGAADFEPMS